MSEGSAPQAPAAGADTATSEPPAAGKLLIILSMPRSGSNFLSDLADNMGFGRPDEFFHPFHMIDDFRDAWGIADRPFDRAEYVRAWKRHHATPSGWLGLSLHASHIAEFEAFEPYLEGLERHWIVLRREQVVRQAVSLAIAMQTEQWKSDETAVKEPVYDYARIRLHLGEIQTWQRLIEYWIRARGIAAPSITYESLVADRAATLSAVPPFAGQEIPAQETRVRRQSTSINQEWAERFAADFLEDEVAKLTRYDPMARARAEAEAAAVAASGGHEKADGTGAPSAKGFGIRRAARRLLRRFGDRA